MVEIECCYCGTLFFVRPNCAHSARHCQNKKCINTAKREAYYARKERQVEKEANSGGQLQSVILGWVQP